MTRWQLTGLVVGAAAMLFTARPTQAQVWFGPPAGPPPFGPPVVRPVPPVWPVPPIGVVPGPVVTPPVWAVPPVGVVPPSGVVPGPVVVGPGWGPRSASHRSLQPGDTGMYRAAHQAAPSPPSGPPAAAGPGQPVQIQALSGRNQKLSSC